MEELFDAVEYSKERRLKLVVLQLRSMLNAGGKEYTPESYYNNREREFDNLKQGFLLIVMSLLMSSSLSSPAGLLAPADLSSSADHDVVTDDIIIDGPLRCSSWFPFDVPAGPSSSSSACSWFLSFQLVHYAPAGSTWSPPDTNN
ncbi:hypothetical protein F511_04988 [Dorcoceras hygrometricum]|uniref:Uncharacterized protein n=1 Tax=Dorcoceras hygrometricum TaxID=472368 RepID=A0A2Z7D9M3_9LAMI|nr:hypothetical protein F511_04988 [Dorcoceras hygrometricum]